MLNVDDLGSAINEMQRCARMGLAGSMITQYPHEEHNYFSDEYDPLWAAAQDLDISFKSPRWHKPTGPGPGIRLRHRGD